MNPEIHNVFKANLVIVVYYLKNRAKGDLWMINNSNVTEICIEYV